MQSAGTESPQGIEEGERERDLVTRKERDEEKEERGIYFPALLMIFRAWNSVLAGPRGAEGVGEGGAARPEA